MGCINFLGLECFTLGTVVEGVSNGFFIGWQFLAAGIAEVIETSRRNEERVAVFCEGFLDVGVGGIHRNFHGDIAAGPGELRESFHLEEVALHPEDFFELELGEVDRRAEGNLARTRRQELGVGANGLAIELNITGEEEALAISW